MKKRVLQLIGSFHQGGSERQAVNLTRLLKQDGRCEVFAATLNNEGVLRPRIEELGLSSIPEFPLTSFYNANFVKQVRRCAAYMREQQIDLVHTHDFYTNVFGMAAATLARVPGRIASKRETAGMRSRSQEFVEEIAFGRASKIVVNSKAVLEYMTTRHVPAEKMTVIYNGLDVGSFTAKADGGIRSELGLPLDVRLISMVANLRHTVKNVPMLLRAAKHVASQRIDVHFVIAGEGRLEKELVEQAAELGIGDRVHFIGRCTNVPALLAESYACVLTSTAEGFSNSIIEYMAAGKPIVATNVGGAAEAIISDQTGYLVESNDDRAMAARLLELLNDEVLATRMGTAGRVRAEGEFSEQTQLDKTIELYDSLSIRS